LIALQIYDIKANNFYFKFVPKVTTEFLNSCKLYSKTSQTIQELFQEAHGNYTYTDPLDFGTRLLLTDSTLFHIETILSKCLDENGSMVFWIYPNQEEYLVVTIRAEENTFFTFRLIFSNIYNLNDNLIYLYTNYLKNKIFDTRRELFMTSLKNILTEIQKTDSYITEIVLVNPKGKKMSISSNEDVC
jgi:hypothetical protein